MAAMIANTGSVATLRQNGSGKSPNHAWLGLPAALVATLANLPQLVSRQPGTPLRVLAVIAITAALRSRGVKLRPDLRHAVIAAMELGALLNDRFDGDASDPNALRRQVVWFAQSPHRNVVWDYAKRLRRYERARPDPNAPAPIVRCYRENVNRVSLALLWALASGTTLADAELETRQTEDLRLLFNLVMLTQVIDDVWDVHHDRRRRLPSFAAGPAATVVMLRAAVRSYTADPPLRLNRNFCLRLALGATAIFARGMLTIHPLRGVC